VNHFSKHFDESKSKFERLVFNFLISYAMVNDLEI